ncbi:MAG: response regulator transcription factor [Nitrospirota bacterium]|jgi:DNA-binding NarL/FixJ family response regulator
MKSMMKQSAIQELSVCTRRIALLSNNPVLRRGLHMILKEAPFVSEIAEIAMGSQAVEIVAREKPQVIVVDLKLADADTSALIRAMRAAAADSHILALSGLNDETLIRKALAAGAEGVVFTIQPAAVLFAAIESLCGGVPRYMDPRPVQSADGPISDRPSARSNDLTRTGFIESLTYREREVIQSLAKGFTNMEIADRLCISETTVRHHFTSIFSKLHVSNRQQLLIAAHRQGLVEFGTG